MKGRSRSKDDEKKPLVNQIPWTSNSYLLPANTWGMPESCALYEWDINHDSTTMSGVRSLFPEVFA
jgi:hypothetical protein